jgi:acetylglutamate kinase
MDEEDENSVIPTITSEKYKILKKEKKIHSGMLPKIHNCFEALKKGVTQVCIGNPKMITGKVNHTQIQL